jgi:rRNA maturation protein Nop10
MCLSGYKIIFAWWAHSALKAEWQSGGRECRFFTVSAVQISSTCGKRTKTDVPFEVQNNICLVGYIALRAEWQSGGRECRFFTVSAVQISSACGKRTKTDVPFEVQNNMYRLGTWPPQGGMAEWRPGTQVLHRERHTNIIGLR